jgi:chaperonin GroES
VALDADFASTYMFGTHQAGVLTTDIGRWPINEPSGPNRAVLGLPSKIGGDMNFRPLHDRVLLQPLDLDDKTSGGIIIPDTAKEKPQEGKVIAVGPGARDENGKIHPLDVKKGDVVLFGKWSGTEVKIDGDEYVIMKESDIMGLIEGSVSKKKAA